VTVTLSDSVVDSLTAQLLVAVPDVPVDFAEDLVNEAIWTVSTLLHDYYHGEQCVEDQYQVVSGCKEVCLTLGPVNEITAVNWYDPCTADLVEVPEGSWCLKPPRTLSADCFGSGSYIPTNTFLRMLAQGFCPPCDCGKTLLRVNYCVDSTLPPGANRAFLAYAVELGKQFLGQPCLLPQRIQTITRQGVTWTLLDPGTHIQLELTGVDAVDNWLIVARRAIGGQVIDPLCGQLVSRTVTSTEAPTLPAAVGEPAFVPLRIYQGDDFMLTVRVSQSGSPINITGFVFAAEIRDGYADDAPVTETFTITIDDAPGGILNISLTDLQTAAIDAGDYRWDLQMTDGSETTTLLAGPVTVIPQVTSP